MLHMYIYMVIKNTGRLHVCVMCKLTAVFAGEKAGSKNLNADHSVYVRKTFLSAVPPLCPSNRYYNYTVLIIPLLRKYK